MAPPEPTVDLRIARWIALAEDLLSQGRSFRTALREQLARGPLREPEFSVLWATVQGPSLGVGQKELAGQLAVSQPHVSALVEQLRRQGLLEGRRDPQDRRRQVWRVTPRGHLVLATVVQDLASWAARLDRSVGVDLPDAIRGLLALLQPAAASPDTSDSLPHHEAA